MLRSVAFALTDSDSTFLRHFAPIVMEIKQKIKTERILETHGLIILPKLCQYNETSIPTLLSTVVIKERVGGN